MKDLERAKVALREHGKMLGEKQTEFYEGLWDIQSEQAEKATSLPESMDTSRMEEWYWKGKPLFTEYPPAIDPDVFAETLARVSASMSEAAGLNAEAQEILSRTDWNTFVRTVDLELAGTDPLQFIEVYSGNLEKGGLPQKIPSDLIALILGFSIKPMIMPAAEQLMEALDLGDDQTSYSRPLACPVCGGPPAVSGVMETISQSGRCKVLYCALCGTEWEFERIRCPRCGTTDQQHLHYFHLEGDDTRRLYSCDECEGYTRTVFLDDKGTTPLCLMAEDIITAPLDAVAHDPRFKSEVTPS